MSIKFKRFYTVFLTGALCFSSLAGCSSADQKQGQETSKEPEQETAVDGDDEDLGRYKPSDFAMEVQDKYEYPYLGLSFTVPQSLLDAMDKKEAAMLNEVLAGDNDSEIDYGFFSWNLMTDEQRDAEVEGQGTGFYDWAAELERIGVLGVYHSDQIKNLDQLTKCSEHKELGKSEDGVYTYYLSINPEADTDLTKAVSQIEAEITKITPLEEENSHSDISSLGSFSTQDINGKDYTEKMFEEYELTMVNVFTTWCTPCINEIPDLQMLSEEMADQGVAVVGVVLDASDGMGHVIDDTVQKAKVLAERTEVSYPFLIPDESNLNGRLEGIDAVPETFFVDKNGTIVGQTYSGSHSLEEWKRIVEETLGSVKGDGQ